MNKEIRHLCAAVLDGQIPLAEELARRLTAPRRSSKPRSKRPARVEKATKKATRRERMAAIREKVRDDAGGLCELCNRPGSEAHHVISGPLRRIHEAVQTVLWLCVECHHNLHAGDLDALESAHAYCSGSGMHDAAAALAKRIDKAMESRASRPERGTT